MARRILVAVSAAVLVGAFAAAASANHSWGSYHWGRTANPFTLTVIDSTSSGWTSYVNTAVGDWSSSAVLNLSKTTGTAKRRCPAVSGKIQVCNDTYGNNGWLGVASIWTASGSTHIAQATTKLNDTYFNSPTYNTPAYRQLVACQEIGHDFGLDHQDENFSNANLGTCMDYTSSPSSNQHPNQGDYDQLLCIYDPSKNGSTLSTSTHSCRGTGHLDSSNSYSNGIVQAPGQGVIVSREGNLTQISVITYANPIH
jgi:hypothetical protein